MILLCLNNVASKHLWILDLNLRIVENIIIVIDVLNNFNRLVPVLLLGLGGAASALVGSMKLIAQWLGGPKILLMRIRKILLITRQIAPLNLIVSHLSCWQGVIRRCIFLLDDLVGFLLNALLLLILIFDLILLINNLSRVIDFIIFNTLRLQIFRTTITGLIKVKLLFLGFFAHLILLILLLIPIRIFWLQIIFITISCSGVVIIIMLFLLIYRISNTRSFDLLSTPCLICAIMAGGAAADGGAARQRSRFRTCLILLLLEPIQPRPLQTTL